MNKSSILNENPNTVLGWPISDRAQVVLHYLVPAVLNSVIYVLVIAADVALVYEHFLNERELFALLTLFFLCLPALFCSIFTTITVEYWPKKGFVYFVGWIVVKTIEHICFPIWAMYGCAERIFWSIEAVRSEGEEREICLWKSIKTRPIELYFFFQPYLQCAPQLLLQINILLHMSTFLRDDTVKTQLLSIVLSLVSMAKTTMHYQHYESQKLLGRRYPWSRRRGTYLINQKVYDHVSSESKDADFQFFEEQNESISNETKQSNERVPMLDNEELIQYNDEPKRILVTHADIHEPNDEDDTNKTSNKTIEHNYLPVLPSVNSATKPPDFPAPSRPRTSNTSSAIDNTEITNFDNQSKSSVLDYDRIQLPIRKYPQQARSPDDTIGKVILFTIWFCFILVRMLSISVFARFFTNLTFYFVGVHYLITVIVLLVYVKPKYNAIDRITQLLFLAYVYVFCVIEFRVKFKYFYRTLLCYFIIVYTENLTLCAVWYLEDWDSWWFDYLFYLILCNKIMCVAFILMYIKILKPSKEVVYNLN